MTKAREPLGALEVHLRVGRSEDAARLAEVFVAAWRAAYPGVIAEEVLSRLDEEETATWLGTLLGSDGSSTVVAESGNGELLGFCRYGDDPDDAAFGHIFSLYVMPSASRRGVGRRLLAGALEGLARRRAGTVRLWVFQENERALAFYSAFGFSPDGARRVEAEYGADEIRLCRVTGGGS